MSSKFRKVIMMASSLVTDPKEFYHRLSSIVDAKINDKRRPVTQYVAHSLDNDLTQIEQKLGVELKEFLNEATISEVEQQLIQRADEIRPHAPFPLEYNADMTLARLCYAICRAFKPAVMVETGVAYGRSSSFILAAMECNGKGVLHSVDRPPLEAGAAQYVGALIPQPLRSRWTLHQGTSRRILPPLLKQLGKVDIFMHDSLHTYRNMAWEYRVAGPYIQRGGLLISDDIAKNAAFKEWIDSNNPSAWVVVQHVGNMKSDKRDMVGVAVIP